MIFQSGGRTEGAAMKPWKFIEYDQGGRNGIILGEALNIVSVWQKKLAKIKKILV